MHWSVRYGALTARLVLTTPSASRADLSLRDSDRSAMTGSREQELGGAELREISNAVVQVVREFTGRGPTQARASIRDDVLVVLLQESLLKAEHSLINDNKSSLVVQMRRSFQQTMRGELSAAVERITGREVLAFMSDSHLEPDYSIEVFVLAPVAEATR